MRRPWLYAAITSSFLCVHAGCSNGQFGAGSVASGEDDGEEGDEPSTGDPEGEPADQPVWINGVSLTCAYTPGSSDLLTANCLVSDAPAGSTVTWTLLVDGSPVPEVELKPTGPTSVSITQPQEDFVPQTLRASIDAGEAGTGQIEYPFAEDLAGDGLEVGEEGRVQINGNEAVAFAVPEEASPEDPADKQNDDSGGEGPLDTDNGNEDPPSDPPAECPYDPAADFVKYEFSSPIKDCFASGKIWNPFAGASGACGSMPKSTFTCTWDNLAAATASGLPAGVDRSRFKLVGCGEASDGKTVVGLFVVLDEPPASCAYDPAEEPMGGLCLSENPSVVSQGSGKTNEEFVGICSQVP